MQRGVLRRGRIFMLYTGSIFTDDACNAPYALLFQCLTKRAGILPQDGAEVSEPCAGVDLMKVACAAKRLPPGLTCLAYVIQKQALSMQSISVSAREKLGDILEASGAMCDVSQLKPRKFQSDIAECTAGRARYLSSKDVKRNRSQLAEASRKRSSSAALSSTSWY